MAHITRQAAIIFINQMLQQYKALINTCKENKGLLTPEAIQIINDYDSKGINNIILNALKNESYFSELNEDELYTIFDKIRNLIINSGIQFRNEIITVDGVGDQSSLSIMSDAYKSTGTKNVEPGKKVLYYVMQGDKELDNLFSKLQYAVEWELEKIETPEMVNGVNNKQKNLFVDSLENSFLICNQFDRSYTLTEPGKYKVTANVYKKDIWGRQQIIDVITYEQEVSEGETKTLLEDCWKVYLDKEKVVTKVEYGTDRKKVQIINSDGTVSDEIEMVGENYEGKGFAKKLLTAAGIETTEQADADMQNKMLDDGLFYINSEEGWIEKQKYFERMTAKDFLTIQDYKDVTVKAVYKDNGSTGTLTFTYTVGGKTENLFVINASNNQRKRDFPTINGTFYDEAMKTMPNDDNDTKVAYIPGKFPKGNWKITSFEKDGSEEYGPYKIRTNANRKVIGYKKIKDENNIENWIEIRDENDELQYFNDGHLLIHGGGPKTNGDNLNILTNLDSRKGSNNYTYSTLGCIRISNIDVLLIVNTLSNYINNKKFISLEIK